MTIEEFLLARIAEDESVAREVSASNRADVERGLYSAALVELDASLWATDGNFGQLAVYVHPARVMAECEAKRRILSIHVGHHPCETVLALASAYAGHPDFQEEWRAESH